MITRMTPMATPQRTNFRGLGYEDDVEPGTVKIKRRISTSEVYNRKVDELIRENREKSLPANLSAAAQKLLSHKKNAINF